MTGGLWTLVTILGPILLIAAIIYAFMRNRGGSRRQVARAEQGAADVREDIKRDPEYRAE